MPMYEYECTLCGGIFEHIKPFGECYTVCVFCGCARVKKLISAPAIIEKFDPYMETDIYDKPIKIRTKQDLRDAVAKYNDGEWASKTGKLAVLDRIKTDRIKR